MFSIAEISKTFLTEHFTPLYNTDIIPLTSRPALTIPAEHYIGANL